MAAVFPIANYESGGTILANTNKTAIITVPSNFWYDLTHLIVNLGTGVAGTNAVVSWSDASAAAEYTINDAGAVAAGVPFELEGMPLHMEAGDILYVKAAANYHVVWSVSKGSNAPMRQPNAEPSGFRFGQGWGQQR